jgi:hypothetical protein
MAERKCRVAGTPLEAGPPPPDAQPVKTTGKFAIESLLPPTVFNNLFWFLNMIRILNVRVKHLDTVLVFINIRFIFHLIDVFVLNFFKSWPCRSCSWWSWNCYSFEDYSQILILPVWISFYELVVPGGILFLRGRFIIPKQVIPCGKTILPVDSSSMSW